MRLSSVDAAGPRLLLEKGEAHVHVFHRDGVEWRFDAGPFVIIVKGTSFVVRWNEKDKEFNLRLRSGAVTVTGPLTSGQLQVREGQMLSARLKDGEIVLREDKPEPATAAAAPNATPPAEPAPAREAEASAVPRDRRTADAARNWNKKLASGKVLQVLAEAQALGIESVLEDSSAPDLEALGDAARYSGRDDIARSALLAERRRFPNSARSARASFFMGRIEDGATNWQSALSWYETYLREAPGGTYASEALGGKMTAVRHAFGNEKARPIAREYMHRFPNGSYAAAARVLVSQP
jgi:TolA-binding protein